jgi:FXSXX-COOH protein
MDSVPDHRGDGPDHDSRLVNVSAMRLAEVLSTSDSALANAVRRMVEELLSSEEPVAAFGNAPR